MFGCLECEEILVPNPDINCPRATASATRCDLHFNMHQKQIPFFVFFFPINEMPIVFCNLELQSVHQQRICFLLLNKLGEVIDCSFHIKIVFDTSAFCLLSLCFSANDIGNVVFVTIYLFANAIRILLRYCVSLYGEG